MEAGRLVDSFGLRPGYEIQQSDAVQAYLQVRLRGKPTWVLLPRDQRLASWKTMRRPVCRLNVALYGHPDSGTDWEHHCKRSLNVAGFLGVGVSAGHRAFIIKSLIFCLAYMLMILSWQGQWATCRRGGLLYHSIWNSTHHNSSICTWVVFIVSVL
jgi:hypothetical protein